MPRRNLPPIYESLRFAVCSLGRRSPAVREEYLRKRLRRSPRWVDGHLWLAETIFLEAVRSNSPVHQRSRSGIRVSASAAKVLLGNDPTAIPAAGELRNRREQEAELWLACYEFLGKRYDAALIRFERVLEAENVKQISKSQHYLALEYAASAAAVVGREQDARQFLEEIPTKYRPRDVQFLERILEAKQ